MGKKKQVDPIPEEFASYEEAAEFWDTHDTTDYPDVFHSVEVKSELKKRHHEIEVDADVLKELRAQAQRKGVTLGHLASDILRRELTPHE